VDDRAGHGSALPRGFAQPSAPSEPAAQRDANRSTKSLRRRYPHEFMEKIRVMIFSPNRAPGRFCEPWQVLARRPSTTLSTTFVDKRKTTGGSLSYRAFLRVVATSRAN
jgi:hypothetical protein